MAEWPSAAEVAARIGIAWDELAPDANVVGARDAAVEQVQIDVSGSAADFAADGAQITSSLAQAAMLLSIKVLKAPDAPYGVAGAFDTGALYVARNDPQYSRLLKGQRQSFGIA